MGEVGGNGGSEAVHFVFSRENVKPEPDFSVIFAVEESTVACPSIVIPAEYFHTPLSSSGYKRHI
jgi:hypothetical protein